MGEGLFEEIKGCLESRGLRLRQGTIVDANHRSAVVHQEPGWGGDPEMHQTKKGNQYHFGMKVHIGVDADTGVVHSLATTPTCMT